MAQVKKAVITAAGRGSRLYPATQMIQKEMMPLVDRDGATKPVIQIIVEEAVASGIEEICIVVSPTAQEQIGRHFQGLSPEQERAFADKQWALEDSRRLQAMRERITFARQETPEGFGHAVYCAREFVGDDPFLLLLGDHVYISNNAKPCSRQLIDVFEEHGAPVSGVVPTPEDLVHLYGAVAGTRISDTPPTYEVTTLVEKPTADYAEAHLMTPGLRRWEYLCFFGIYVFPAALFECIGHHIEHDIRERGEIQLTNALEMLRRQGRYLAAEVEGKRYDMGVPFGYLQTQLALALNSPDRPKVLASLPSLFSTSVIEGLR